MKSERTRDLASTSLSTSPRERYRSEVTKRTVLGEVCRHHLDFLRGEKHIRKAQKSYSYRELRRTWCMGHPEVNAGRILAQEAHQPLAQAHLFISRWTERGQAETKACGKLGNQTSQWAKTWQQEQKSYTQPLFFLEKGKDCVLPFSAQRQRCCQPRPFPRAAWHSEAEHKARSGAEIYTATQAIPAFKPE